MLCRLVNQGTARQSMQELQGGTWTVRNNMAIMQLCASLSDHPYPKHDDWGGVFIWRRSLQLVLNCLLQHFQWQLEAKGNRLVKCSVDTELGDSTNKSADRNQIQRDLDRLEWRIRTNDMKEIESIVKLKQLDAPGKGDLRSRVRNESSGLGWLHTW